MSVAMQLGVYLAVVILVLLLCSGVLDRPRPRAVVAPFRYDVKPIKEQAELSIDAIIHDSYMADDGLCLMLRRRPGVSSGPGQPTLTIVNPTWDPPLDVPIWGGDSLVVVETVPQRHYRRMGYTWLREDFSHAEQPDHVHGEVKHG